MENVNTIGFVIKSFDFQETSKIIKVYTADKGLVSLIAKGARRPKNKFRGQIEMFTKMSLTYQEKDTRDIQVLTEAELLDFFGNIYMNEVKMGLLLRVMKLLNHVLMESKVITGLFHLIEETMMILNKRNVNEALSAYFRFLYLFLEMNGVGLNFENCQRCDKAIKNKMYFDHRQALFVCDQCIDYLNPGTYIHHEVSSAIINCLELKLDHGEIREDTISQIWSVFDHCYQNQFQFKLLRLK